MRTMPISRPFAREYWENSIKGVMMKNRFRVNQKGRAYLVGDTFVPSSLIDKKEKERTKTVIKIANAMDRLNAFEAKIKEQVTAWLFDFLADNPDHKQPTAKGNITLTSLDDRVKVTVKSRTLYDANENINRAKDVISELFTEWQQSSHPALSAIAGLAAKVNSRSRLSYSDVMNFKRLQIKDSRWFKAMELLDSAFFPTGSKQAIYVYWRPDTTSEWIEIPHQWSKV